MISLSSLSLPLVGMFTRFVLRRHGGHRKIRSTLAVDPLGLGVYPSLCRVHGRYPGVRQAVEIVSEQLSAEVTASEPAAQWIPGTCARG
jgi:hypothetical protein